MTDAARGIPQAGPGRGRVLEITGGELLSSCLANEGVELVFGLPCADFAPILAALDEHWIQFVPVRHPAAAVPFADGCYRAGGPVSAVLGGSGPDAAHLLPGVIAARLAGVPLLVVTAPAERDDPFPPATRWSRPITDWRGIPDALRRAFCEMWSGTPGPVHLAVPRRLLDEAGDPATAPILPVERARGAPRPAPTPPRGAERAGTRDELGRLLARLEDPALARASSRNRGLHPADAICTIGRVFGRDALYVADGGMTSLWAQLLLPPIGPAAPAGAFASGRLGTGVPSAIGAKLADPSRCVVCVTGDGAAGFHFLEMQSAAREGLAVNTVVLADGAWTMEEAEERLRWGRTFGTAMGEVRWDRVAEGLGCQGFFADAREDLERVLELARVSDAPTVICVRTDREAELALPAELAKRLADLHRGGAWS